MGKFMCVFILFYFINQKKSKMVLCLNDYFIV